MKTLEFESLGLVELDSQEMENTDGGIFFMWGVFWICVAIGAIWSQLDN